VSSERRFIANIALLLNNRTQFEDRQIHGDNQSTNEYTEDRHDHGLQQT
jgi:hypothetical protein